MLERLLEWLGLIPPAAERAAKIAGLLREILSEADEAEIIDAEFVVRPNDWMPPRGSMSVVVIVIDSVQ